MGRDEYHLLVTVKYLELDFSHLDEDSEEEVALFEQENIELIFLLKLAFDGTVVASFEATATITNP